MNPIRQGVIRLNLPDFLVVKCQGLLEDIQRCDSVNMALLIEQRAAGFTEALEWLQVIPLSQIEALYALYERAMTERIAELNR